MATRHIKKLPDPKKESVFCRVSLRFGFDCISSDYKIFRIVSWPVITNGIITSRRLVAELYFTDANSWSEIEVPKTLQSFEFEHHAKCVDVKTEALYVKGIMELLSFD